MKIGILTLPLNTNYGGILQAYALQTVLQRMGHEVMVLERKKELPSAAIGMRAVLVRTLTRLFCGKDSPKYVLWGQVDKFKSEYICLFQENDLEGFLQKEKPDAYVVGSDQVWRPFWKENYIPDFFLEFAKNDRKVKKIAYAASFAVDEWEYTEEETLRYAPLTRLFDAVSVREASGVELCRRYFGVDAVQMLDPTLLLDKSDYEKLVDEKKERKNDGTIFSYILDDSPYKQNVIQKVEKQLNASSYKLSYKVSTNVFQLLFANERYQIPAVTKWLRGFMDAEYVITDSFHGCVFSIIFNKPFWAIGNIGRGMARFTSLLAMFGLEDRMLTDLCGIEDFDFSKPIDWVSVNNIKQKWQKKSFDFLSKNL